MRLSIFSSDPLCSPTAIISVTIGGKRPLAASGAARLWPSSTSFAARSMVSPMIILLTTLRTISMAVKSGTPLCRSVASVRENRAMAILRFTEPQTGAFRRNESQKRRPFSVPAVRYLKAAIPATMSRQISHQKDFRKLLTAIRMTVISGSVCFMSVKIPVIFGTTKVMSKKMTREPTRSMISG